MPSTVSWPEFLRSRTLCFFLLSIQVCAFSLALRGANSPVSSKEVILFLQIIINSAYLLSFSSPPFPRVWLLRTAEHSHSDAAFHFRVVFFLAFISAKMIPTAASPFFSLCAYCGYLRMIWKTVPSWFSLQNWSINPLFVHDTSIDWLIELDCLAVFTNRLIGWLIDWTGLDCLAVFIVWLIDWLIDWSNCPMVDWSVDWLIDWIIRWLIDWIVHWLIDWATDSSPAIKLKL